MNFTIVANKYASIWLSPVQENRTINYLKSRSWRDIWEQTCKLWRKSKIILHLERVWPETMNGKYKYIKLGIRSCLALPSSLASEIPWMVAFTSQENSRWNPTRLAWLILVWNQYKQPCWKTSLFKWHVKNAFYSYDKSPFAQING